MSKEDANSITINTYVLMTLTLGMYVYMNIPIFIFSRMFLRTYVVANKVPFFHSCIKLYVICM